MLIDTTTCDSPSPTKASTLSLPARLAFELARHEWPDGHVTATSVAELSGFLLSDTPGEIEPYMAAIVVEWVITDAAILSQSKEHWALQLIPQNVIQGAI